MPTIRINGINLHYEVHGRGPPLVFIHGLGSGGRDWEYQLPVFGEAFQVITFDLRGHGSSDKPKGPYSVPHFAADTAGLLQALEIDAAHVVGLSLGGAVAFQLALDWPALVRSLVIVNSAPEFILRTKRERAARWQRLAIVRLLGMRAMGAVLSRRLFPGPECARLRKEFRTRFGKNHRRAYLESLRALMGWSVTSRLGELRCPTLILGSDHDYTPVATKEAYAAKILNATLTIIPDARHAVPVERPEAFNSALRAFLRQAYPRADSAAAAGRSPNHRFSASRDVSSSE